MSKSLGIFDQEKYKEITLNNRRGTKAGHLSPATTDGIANHAEAVISFFHVPSESDVFFKAFITTFQESYASDWNSETVFGRTDPIYTFKNTQRRITLAWKIPADSIGDAYGNLAKVQSLAQFLYPNYTGVGSTNTLSQSPVVRLKVMNLVEKSGPAQGDAIGNPTPGKTIMNNYTSTNDPSKGLLGVITSLNINHNLENKDIGVIQIKSNTILPKMIEVSIDFAVIHETTLGWNDNDMSTFKDPQFPYNARRESEDLGIPGLDYSSYDEKIEARKRKEAARAEAAQDRANAEARGYDGMFGEMRRKRDQKRLDKLNDKVAAGEDLKPRQQANYEYLSSVQAGDTGDTRANVKNSEAQDAGTRLAIEEMWEQQYAEMEEYYS
jgi:hypothetical protein|tara:strand:+ start:260 stop:1405 length:1146 start_codon:yes stop_codon:yes gene_type:complete